MPRIVLVVQRFSLHVLPLAVMAILIATAVPIELRPAIGWDGGFDAVDFLQNLLLYAPLGMAFGNRRWWILIAVAFTLSMGAEVSQVWSFERFPSPYDVLSNVLGAMMGAAASRRYSRGRTGDVEVNGWWLTAALASSVAILAIWSLPIHSAEIANWQGSFSLMLGNEKSHDRPWRGVISELAILRRPLTNSEIESLVVSPKGSIDELEDALLYRSLTPVTLVGGPAVRLPQALANHLADEITEAGVFTIIARVRPTDLNQTGPARIVSFSDGTLRRNFDLGQERDRVVFRVRTSMVAKPGEDIRAETIPVLKAQTDVVVVAVYDGGVSRVFVNGAIYARNNIAARGCVVRSWCDSGAPLAWSALGASFAIVVFALMPWRSRTSIVLAAMVAGLLAFVLPQLLHSVPADIFKNSWIRYLSLVGAAAIVAAHLSTAPPDGAPKPVSG